MENIQMVDLKGQYKKIKSEIDTAILEVIEKGAFINGPEVRSFAEDLQNYLNATKVIPCANGTDALQIALMALGLKPGDEVITPSFTYIATVEVIALLGLTPKFVEVDPNTFTIDIEALEQAVSENTKAIVPVHLYGQCADMEKILAIASKYNIPTIEDTAQALGADYTFSNGTTKKAGSIGTIGCTSFFPSKNLGCYGDGGAIFTQDKDLGEKIRITANHGQTVKYQHDVIGVNSRLDTLQAAVLKAKLPHLDSYAQARQAAASYYDNRLGKIEQLSIPARANNSTHVFHQYTLKTEGFDRDELQQVLKEKGVPSNVYYPIPVHKQKGYTQYSSDGLNLTEQLCNSVISLPIHTEMTEEIQDYICTQIENYFSK